MYFSFFFTQNNYQFIYQFLEVMLNILDISVIFSSKMDNFCLWCN